MFENTTFGKTLHILERTMAVDSLRRDVIAHNVANADTPNFKRSQISFEAELARALGSERKPVIPLKTTQSEHINPFQPIDYRTVGPRRTLDYLSQSNNNGNNVNLEQEVGDALTGQMRYQETAAIIAYQFQQIATVLS